MEEQLGNKMVWLVLAGACVLGYFVVSKVIDFFVKGSAFERRNPSSENSDDGKIGGIDPNKPIG